MKHVRPCQHVRQDSSPDHTAAWCLEPTHKTVNTSPGFRYRPAGVFHWVGHLFLCSALAFRFGSSLQTAVQARFSSSSTRFRNRLVSYTCASTSSLGVSPFHSNSPCRVISGCQLAEPVIVEAVQFSSRCENELFIVNAQIHDRLTGQW